MMPRLLTVMSQFAVLRDGTLSSQGTNEVQSGLPQALVVLGILVLLLLLAGTVFWRVRRSSRTHMK
jgi:hypothetical protein